MHNENGQDFFRENFKFSTSLTQYDNAIVGADLGHFQRRLVNLPGLLRYTNLVQAQRVFKNFRGVSHILAATIWMFQAAVE